MNASSTRPITKVWCMNLKPHASSTDPSFQSLWREILSFCQEASGPAASGHTLWQNTSPPQGLVMITGFPSRELNEQTDREYVGRGYMKRMFEFVDHGWLWMGDVDVNELPLDTGTVSLEVHKGSGSESTERVEAQQQDILVRGSEVVKGSLESKMTIGFRGLSDPDVKKAGDIPPQEEVMYLRKIL